MFKVQGLVYRMNMPVGRLFKQPPPVPQDEQPSLYFTLQEDGGLKVGPRAGLPPDLFSALIR